MPNHTNSQDEDPRGADLRKSRDTKQKGSPQSDAAPQFVRSRKGASNNGMASANPRVISGDEGGDATFPVKPDEESDSR
jgi:hypothetical protein